VRKGWRNIIDQSEKVVKMLLISEKGVGKIILISEKGVGKSDRSVRKRRGRCS